MRKHRDIVSEHEVSQAIDDAKEAHPRIHEEFAGVEWVLSRSPEGGVPVDGNYLLYVNDRATKGAAVFTILYRYDDNKVYLTRAWIT